MPEKYFHFNCCFTSDSKQAVIFFVLQKEHGFCFIDVDKKGEVNAMLRCNAKISIDDRIFLYKSYCIGRSWNSVIAVDLKSGKKCAESNGREILMPNITMHSNTGTLAVVTNGGCRIIFLKLNVPE